MMVARYINPQHKVCRRSDVMYTIILFKTHLLLTLLLMYSLLGNGYIPGK